MAFYFKVKEFLRNILERAERGLIGKTLNLFVGKERALLIIVTLLALISLFSGTVLIIMEMTFGAISTEALFAYGTTTQAVAETVLYFILNLIAFAGVYLIYKAVSRRIVDALILSTGAIILICCMVILTYIVFSIKLRIF